MRLARLFIFILIFSYFNVHSQHRALVFQSDFGLKDGAVAAMKGVAFGVSHDLQMFDITHEIPAYNIWEAAYRLNQAAPYWPAGTVFVSIVDPGVGSERKSVVAKTRSGHYIVTPDNGTLTLVAQTLGINEVREIDEAKNRLKGSEQSYTFYGRDVYAYTGARLAAGVITFEEVGAKVEDNVVRIEYQGPVYKDNEVTGNIPVLDIQYGNVWTNIDKATFQKLEVNDGERVRVTIYRAKQKIYEGEIPFAKTFADVPEGESMCYLNSLLNFSLAINQGNFSEHYKVYSGDEWNITIKRVR